MSHQFFFKNSPPDLGPISTRYQWCCSMGCGQGDPILVEYRTFVRTSNGEVEAQQTEPRMVSSCCGESMFLWDSAIGNDGPRWFDGQLLKEEGL